MRFKCEIDNIRTLKKGMKLTLGVDDKQTRELMKNIYNFMDKPLLIDMQIDDVEQQERLQQISPEQRKKIYALFRDIASYTGNTPEDIKETLKYHFVRETEYEPFSLSNCSWKLASDFIEWLLDFAFENGVGLSEHPLKTLDDIEKYVRMGLKHKLCAVCGKPGEVHHWDSIGMGRDRRYADDSDSRKICLCREHHNEAHQIGRESFQEKYHVYGVVWGERR